MPDVIAATGPRTAAEVLADSRDLLEPALREAVDTLPLRMRHVAGYHFGWWDVDGGPTGRTGGKAIRPALTLLTARAVGDSAEPARPAAVAVELIHNFSLLHDDVIDGDLTRRHRPTAWSVFGQGAAILAGDALSTLAADVVASAGRGWSLEGVRMINTAVQTLIDGQSLDIDFEDRREVAPAECRRMAEAKTGALLSCACAIGALSGGAEPAVVSRLGVFGARLGLAFQFVDDLLGIWGDPKTTGKPVYSDLHNRKKSLPVVAALSSGTAAAGELAELYGREAALETADLARAATLIDESGGRAWSLEQIDVLFAEAMGSLADADLTQTSAAELESLARLIVHRDH
ncbi:MAG: family 2 encapsulin nanocompartment cargo protein polyprenyl transferase [Stackebrandtia sp.]